MVYNLLNMNRILNRLLLVSILIFIIVFTYLIYTLFLKTPKDIGLKVDLIGPTNVDSLKIYNYKIEVINPSNQIINNLNIKINLSNGIFLSENLNEKVINYSFKNLNPQSKISQEFSLIFINPGNLKETINISINYKLGNKENIFSKEETFPIFVQNSPLNLKISLPSKIYINQEFQSTFSLINETEETLENIKISIETPTFYLLKSSLPENQLPFGKDYYVEIEKINPYEEKEFNLIGQIQNIKSSGIFTFKIMFSYKNMDFELNKEIAKINILENPVVFYIKSMPESDNVQIGSGISYEVSLINRSQTPLENGEVRIYIDGPVDWSSLQISDNGYFDINEKYIIWNARNKKELSIINPQQSINFKIFLMLYQSYPIFGENKKNFTIKIRAEFRSPSIPIEIETPSKEFVIYQEDEKRIIGKIRISSYLTYNESNFDYSGPFPLENGQPTLITWHIKVDTLAEDFENLVLSTVLPFGVNFTGKVGGDAIIDNVRYDSRTGSFMYEIPKLEANLGYSEDKKSIDLIFQLLVQPSGNINPNDFIIINKIDYSVTGSFSKSRISGSLDKQLSGGYIIKF